jgi:putative NADH-flavin reductase
MNVVLFGASGMIGSRILQELVARGHSVTAVVRDTAKVPVMAGVTTKRGDVLDVDSVATNVKGSDAVISAYAPGFETLGNLVLATQSLIAGLQKAGVRRFLMVGGAGSLEVAPGLQLVDAPDFPAAWKGIALAHRDALNVLKGSDLDWTSLSPAALIEPGVRTGKFRLGTDQLVMDDKGESKISAEDFAVAAVDELEKNAHVRQRFTLGY